MRVLRTGTPDVKEMWDIPEIMNYLKCDEMKARRFFESYHAENGGGYGSVEKALMLDYIERKQREEREREARHLSDLANIESSATLKEQVKALREQVKVLKDQDNALREQVEVLKGQDNALREQVAVLRQSAESSSRDALKTRIASYISNVIAAASLIVAVIAMLLNLN